MPAFPLRKKSHHQTQRLRMWRQANPSARGERPMHGEHVCGRLFASSRLGISNFVAQHYYDSAPESGPTHRRSQASREDAIGSIVIAAAIALREPCRRERMRSNSKTILAAIRRVTPSAFALRTTADRSTDLPDGLSGDGSVQPPLQKYSAFPVGQIISTSSPVPSHRGAARDRHGRGAGCGGRGCALDEWR